MFYCCQNCGQNVGITTAICPKCSTKGGFKLSTIPVKKKTKTRPLSSNFIDLINRKKGM